MAHGYDINTENAEDCSNQGELEYPVNVYFMDTAKLYLNTIGWHWHSEIEIMIVNQGEALFFADDTKIPLKPGEGIFVNQNIIHKVRPLNADTTCSLYCVNFHPAYLFGYGTTMMSSKFLAPVLSSPILQTLKLNEADPWQARLLDCVNNIIAVNLSKKFGYELLTKSHLCMFWSHLLENVLPQNATQLKSAMLSLDESRVKAVIQYIEKHYMNSITLDDLAKTLHISKSECCRCFKRTIHLTPIEYLMKYRIFMAVKLMQQGDPLSRSSSDLAFHVGFNNASYFNKVFREYLQCTPTEYKKALKEDSSKAFLNFNPIKI